MRYAGISDYVELAMRSGTGIISPQIWGWVIENKSSELLRVLL